MTSQVIFTLRWGEGKKRGEGKLLPSGAAKLATKSPGKKERKELISDLLHKMRIQTQTTSPSRTQKHTLRPSQINGVFEYVHNILYLIRFLGRGRLY